jgi:hypothetical protein
MPKATKYNAEERRWSQQAKAAHAIRMSDKERERRAHHTIVNIDITTLREQVEKIHKILCNEIE